MQDLGLWVDCQGALEIMVLCSYTGIFSWRDTRLNRKAMMEKFGRVFTNQKVISLLH